MNPPPTSLAHLGFEAWVTCSHKPVPVYSVEVHGNKVTCWIASEAGKEFAVHTKMVDRTLRLNVASRVFVDGAFINGKVLGTVEPCTNAEANVVGVPLGASSYQKLAFATLSMSDDDSATNDSAVLATLGTIAVKIARCTVLSKSAASADDSGMIVPDHLKPGNLTVHEKAKKLGGHHTTIGAIQQVPLRIIVSTLDIDPPGTTYIEFEFKYRPKDVLQAQDIIPVERQPTPVPHQEPAKRPRESSALRDTTNAKRPAKKAKKAKDEPAEEDAAALRARIRELEARLEAHGDSVDVKPKVEPIHASRAFKKGQVVDLTEDD